MCEAAAAPREGGAGASKTPGLEKTWYNTLKMKPIRLSGHAKEQLFFRGTTEEEVIETVKGAPWQPAESGRLESKKNFIFEKEWNKRYYKVKQVRPIFVEEKDEIVVVTVYVYFFEKEGQ